VNERRIRWGVLSTANIGRAAVNPAIQGSRNGTLVAVASREAGRAAEFADRHAIPERHGSYQALLENPNVDAIYLPLPNSMHREWTVRAADAGKHVLCEKPLALSVAECDDMIAAAERNGVKLMEAFMYRFHPRLEQLVTMVRAGVIGRVTAIRSAFTFRLTDPANIRLNAALGGGALMDVGCYCVNVSRTVAGEEPIEAQAWAVFGPSGVDERLAGALRFPSGVIAQFDCALTMERREAVEVAGTDAALELRATFLPGKGAVEIEERRGRAAPVLHSAPASDQYRLMVEHFADCVLHDRPVRFPPADARANLAAIEALYASAKAGGRPIRL
jgi:predicted dehydrogenase